VTGTVFNVQYTRQPLLISKGDYHDSSSTLQIIETLETESIPPPFLLFLVLSRNLIKVELVDTTYLSVGKDVDFYRMEGGRDCRLDTLLIAGLWIRIRIQHFSSFRYIQIHKVIESGFNADTDQNKTLENTFFQSFSKIH
jgi:hypothetical protein